MIILSAFSSCGDKDIAPHPYEALTKEYFDSLADDAFRTNSQIIRDNIIKIAKKDADGTAAAVLGLANGVLSPERIIRAFPLLQQLFSG